ncbi:MAG: hypothetical protein RLZZ466_661 [Bacteroidota bacterium]|jgi:hypothetical protein
MIKKVIQKVKNFPVRIFSQYKFSELSELGDLSRYTLDDFKNRIKKMKIEEFMMNEFLLVLVSDERTEYYLKYDLNGVFIKIEKEVWK